MTAKIPSKIINHLNETSSDIAFYQACFMHAFISVLVYFTCAALMFNDQEEARCVLINSPNDHLVTAIINELTKDVSYTPVERLVITGLPVFTAKL